MTHDGYLAAIVAAVAEYAIEHAERIRAAKVVYGTGAGRAGVLGTTFYGRWQNGHPDAVALVEVSAFQQDTPSQVAVTAVHELAHEVAPVGAGHGAEWKRIAGALGLAAPSATSSGAETWDSFLPEARAVLGAIPVPTDGKPLPPAPRPGARQGPRPCSAGNGVRGGRSRGSGSGSRMVKCTCAECGYTVRTTAKWLSIGAPICPVDDHGPMEHAVRDPVARLQYSK